MNIGNYDINKTSPHWWVVFIGFIASVILLTRFINKGMLMNLMNNQLQKIYALSEHALEVVKQDTDVDQKTINKGYKSSKSVLKNYRNIYARLAKKDFYENQTTREIAENTLSNFYELEAHLRMLSFTADCVPAPEDKELIEMASRLSMSSLS